MKTSFASTRAGFAVGLPRFRRALRAGCAVAAGVALSVASTALADSASVIGQRQAYFKQLGGALKAVSEALRDDRSDKAAFAADVDRLDQLARALPARFPRGSGPEGGARTGAKAEIWSDPKGFAAAAGRLAAETNRLDQAGRAGDLDAARLRARAVGEACKNCHDSYRSRSPFMFGG